MVLVVSNLEYGGAQRQAVELANHLGAEGFETHICSLSGYVPLASELSNRARRLHVIRKWFKYDATVVPRLARLLRDLRADVVQGILFDAEIAARLAGRLAGTPLVVGSERNSDYYLKRGQRVVYCLTRGCVDKIIANSNAGVAFSSRTLGHAPQQYHVVHNGVNIRRFTPQAPGPIRSRLGIASHEAVVGMFASFKRQKNHPLFFAAATGILAGRPQTRFLLVGDELQGGLQRSDEYKRQMNRLVDELGLRARCLFLGNRADVADLYCACDVTVLPSLFEGTANVLLESMACGVPVVATAVSDNGYIVPDGRVGYVVALGDSEAMVERILRLLRDAELREEMGRLARSWVGEEFSTLRLAQKTAAVYRTALNDHGFV